MPISNKASSISNITKAPRGECPRRCSGRPASSERRCPVSRARVGQKSDQRALRGPTTPHTARNSSQAMA